MKECLEKLRENCISHDDCEDCVFSVYSNIIGGSSCAILHVPAIFDDETIKNASLCFDGQIHPEKKENPESGKKKPVRSIHETAYGRFVEAAQRIAELIISSKDDRPVLEISVLADALETMVRQSEWVEGRLISDEE